ncbi:MAG: replicative DNA helicase [Chamaesiphon sp.]
MTQTLAIEGIGNQLPPQNIEAEEAILGGILLDAMAIGRVVDILEPESFYISAHKDIYQACRHLHNQNKSTDLLSVTAWLSDHDLLEQIGGRSKLVQLLERTVSAINIDALAVLVQQKYLSRRLILAGNAITRIGYDQTKNIADRVDSAEQQIFAIRHQAKNDSEPQMLSDICVGVFNQIEQIATTGNKPGIPTGFYDLDNFIGGLYPGDLIVLGGRPSMGKSLLSHSLAYNVANLHDATTMIFSLEMSKQQLSTRFLSNLSGIETIRLREGNINSEEWELLSKAIGIVSEVNVLIDDSPCPSTYEIRSKARVAMAKYGQLKLIVVDYLQLMADGSDFRLVQKLGEITRQLKLLARECNVPIIVVSQLNRGVEERNNKRPTLSDLRDSGRIEEDADVVLAVYRDAYYNPNTPEPNLAEIICLKQRNGPTGTVKLVFDGALSRFRNLAAY